MTAENLIPLLRGNQLSQYDFRDIERVADKFNVCKYAADGPRRGAKERIQPTGGQDGLRPQAHHLRLPRLRVLQAEDPRLHGLLEAISGTEHLLRRLTEGVRRKAESRSGHVNGDPRDGLHGGAARTVVDVPKRQKREARSWRGTRAELSAWSLLAPGNRRKRNTGARLDCARTVP